MNPVHKRQVESVCSSILRELLATRNLQHADGRRLYAYHITDTEYEDIRRVLTEMAVTCSWNTMRVSTAFNALWFLFAAEWWKRAYVGGAWGWHGMFETLHIAEPGQQDKRACVEDALLFWRQKPLPQLGRRFLGMVILNAGLPARLLEDASGRLSSLLRLVLLRVGGVRIPDREGLQHAVQEQMHLLPQTYRHGEGMSDLLADIVFTVLQLRHTHALTETTNPVEKLERVYPDWQKQFPLRLDGAAAGTLLKGLIHDAIQAVRGNRLPICLRRGFRLDTLGAWHPECRIDAVTHMPLEEFAAKLNIDGEQLPCSFDLSLRTESKTFPFGRGMLSNGQVMLRITDVNLPESWFDKTATLGFSRFGELIAACILPGGEAPQAELPWILSDTEPFATLLAVGGARVSAASMLALLPAKASLFHPFQDEEHLVQVGERHLYRLPEGDWLIGCAGDSFQVSCKPGSQQDEALLWQGQRLYLSSQPDTVFKGRPKLFQVVNGEYLAVPDNQLFWRPMGHALDIRIDLCPQMIGMGTVRWKENKTIRSRLQAVCLPEDANIRCCSGRSTQEGVIHLQGWPVQSIVLLEPQHVDMEVIRDGHADWQLVFRTTAQPPVNVKLQLNWPGSGMQTLTLPFPAQGVALCDESGQAVAQDQVLSVEQLLGLRARLLSADPDDRWSLVLKLKGCRSSVESQRRVAFRRQPEESPLSEISLFELIEPVQQMLAAVEELDARVELWFECHGRKFKALTIARYGHDVEPDRIRDEYRLIALPMPDQKALLSTQVQAICLQHPDQQITLHPCLSEDVHTGVWWFDPKQRSPGNWLIFPAADAPLALRPMAWYQPGEEISPPLAGLRATLGINHKVERLEAMTEVLSLMATCPEHPDWRWLSHLLRAVGHLPLSSLDVLVALSRVPSAMVMAHLRLEGFADLYSPRVERELPFEWTLTSPEDWLQGLRRCRQWLNALQDGVPPEIYALLLKRNLQTAANLATGLSMASNQAVAELERRTLPEWQASQSKLRQMLDGQLFALFVGEDCALQRMLRRNVLDRDIWPTTLTRQVLAFAHTTAGARLFQPLGALQDDFKFSVIGLPMLLAFEVDEGAAEPWRTSPDLFSSLKTYRAFDPQWFDDAYQAALVCATCLDLLRNPS